jgi:hypothetical protein
VSAKKPSIVKIIEKVRIWRIFESTETDQFIAVNVCGIDYPHTRLLKRVHWLSISQYLCRRTTDYECENTGEFDTRVAWVSLPITRIHPWVAQESKIQQIPTTVPNLKWMDHRQVCHISPKANPILNPVDVETGYGYSA